MRRDKRTELQDISKFKRLSIDREHIGFDLFRDILDVQGTLRKRVLSSSWGQFTPVEVHDHVGILGTVNKEGHGCLPG